MIYKTRYGLIDMSCAHCHDMYPGQMIRGQRISQGQGNGFPAYRLDTGEMANLDLRIKQCLTLMRAEPFAPDAEESKLLGAYIMSRSNGLKIETPAVGIDYLRFVPHHITFGVHVDFAYPRHPLEYIRCHQCSTFLVAIG